MTLNIYIGHSSDREDKKDQSLEDHLLGVAQLAREHSSILPVTAYLLGLSHDLGKYSAEAQQRMRGSSVRVDHSTAGSQYLHSKIERLKGTLSLSLSWPVACHHSGLLDKGTKADSDLKTLWSRLNKNDLPNWYDNANPQIMQKINESFSKSESELIQFLKHYRKEDRGIALALMVRYLHSSLVDADFLDTEKYYLGSEARDFDLPSIEEINSRIQLYLDPFRESKSGINGIRSEILNTCIEKGRGEKGIYRLNAPTGSGKTKSSLGFCMSQVEKNQLKRIIYVIPYNSITDQVAKEFREALDPYDQGCVLEHFSTYETESKDAQELYQHEKLTENWDAPVIVTTVVQFVETLFAAKNSKLRKLHNIADSVIVFDEVHLLPKPYLKPLLKTLRILSEDYHCSILLMSATNPDFSQIDSDFKSIDILDDSNHYAELFKKVQIQLLDEINQEDLVENLLSHKQALCIVNRKIAAKEIYNLIKDSSEIKEDSLFYLTTNLHQADRIDILKKVRERLKNREGCYLICTSLVEAGVDLDFQTVFRELAGVDNIIQGAGRCNREGKLKDSNNQLTNGQVYVFELKDQKTPRYLSRAVDITREILNQQMDLLDLKTSEIYFKKLYQTNLDVKNLLGNPSRPKGLSSYELMKLQRIGEEVKVIEDHTVSILIPNPVVNEILEELEGINYRKFLHKLQQYIVQIDKELFEENMCYFRRIHEDSDIYLLTCSEMYNSETGLDLEKEIEFII